MRGLKLKHYIKIQLQPSLYISRKSTGTLFRTHCWGLSQAKLSQAYSLSLPLSQTSRIQISSPSSKYLQKVEDDDEKHCQVTVVV